MNFGIIGAGAWGTAFARLVASNKQRTLIWDKNPQIITSINQAHINSVYFPEVVLPEGIIGVEKLEDLKECDVIVLAIPFQALRSFLSSPQISEYKGKQFLMLSKGIEIESKRLGHQIFLEYLPSTRFAVISGPNFASEIVRGLPASTMLAGSDRNMLNTLKSHIMCDVMRVYTTDDLVGVEICGAIKNVIAIAAGISIGSGYGENARASIISKGLEEIKLLVRSMGGQTDTVYSIAGIGDCVLTCSSPTSRNFTYGFEIGKNKGIGGLLMNNNKTIEGVYTAKATYELSQEKALDMPICTEVYKIIFENKSVSDALQTLMQRNQKSN
jgi:glycerol-3-phosphate dehydrogenase (NAD(P)+)